jgi:spermidine synthase
VKPWVRVDQSTAPDGTVLTLQSRDGEYLLLAGTAPLMSSRDHGSEDALAALACRRVAALAAPQVLIGGLGMGFTLRAALDRLPPTARVAVAELIPAVVEWNRGPLGPLAGHPLGDPRVTVEATDVADVIRSRSHAFDALVLDVDNGPSALVASPNAWIYSDAGIEAIRASVAPAGVVAVWMAAEDRRFATRLRRHGFTVDAYDRRGKQSSRPRGPAILIAYQSAGR